VRRHVINGGLGLSTRTEITVTTSHSFTSTVKVRSGVIVTGVGFNVGEGPGVEIRIGPVFLVEVMSNVTNGFWESSTDRIVGSGGTFTPSVFGTGSHTITFRVVTGVTLVFTESIGGFIMTMSFISEDVDTFIIFLKDFNMEIRETHSFITSTLIDGGSEIESSIIIRVRDGNFNIIEVIRPRRSTQVTNIGVGPLGLLDPEDTTIKREVGPFGIPGSNSVESHGKFEVFMSWEVVEITSSGITTT